MKHNEQISLFDDDKYEWRIYPKPFALAEEFIRKMLAKGYHIAIRCNGQVWYRLEDD